MRFLKFLLKVFVVLAIVVLVLRWTHPLPDLPSESSARIPASEETTLGRTFLPEMAANEGLSGVVPFADGRDALASRILLARAAEETIDVQYYIWQMDTTGWLLLEELRAAAERGVRVRMLLDDNGIPGLDNVLADLNSMENVEIRIFNPFTMRKPKLLSYVFDFFRLNHRMHNKSMTVDGVATIIGGRNIGDIYFAYGEGTAYFDFDVMAIGPGAEDVSENFDEYWTSGSSYDAADAKGLMKAAIRCEDPVVFLENELVYGRSFDVPDLDDYVLPIGKARIMREGTDVTIVAYSIAVGLALEAADELADEGIDAEVIDLRTLRPLDREAILTSLAKTNRLVIAEEGWPTCSIASEVMAICMEDGFDHLDAPVTRVCDEDVPLPYAANLEKLALIDTPRIVAAAKKVCYRD